VTLNPLAWQAHEYYDVTGCVELWQVDFVSGRTFTCRRIVFSSLEALQRSTTALVRAVALLLLFLLPGRLGRRAEQLADLFARPLA